MQSPERHTILIVEDEAPIALMERKTLEAEGFTVDTVANGTAALERLEHDDPDLVLLDHRLPDMNGAEVVQALGERLKTLPVIMVAARGDERLAVDMHEAGVADYVCKDVELSFVRELPKTVRAAIDRFALEAENRMLQARLRETHDELERKVGDRTARLAAANEQLRKEIIGRTRLEHDLREAEREKALILDSLSSEIINYSDTECRIKWVNRAGAEAAGARPEDLVGRYCYEVWSDRNAPCEGCPVVRCMRSGKPKQGEMTTPDGRVWLLRGSPVRDEEGKIIGAAETALEVTERKRSEEALRESEERYQDLYDNAPDMFVSVDAASAAIVQCNQTMATALGYDKQEIVGRSVFDLYDPESRKEAREKVFPMFIETGEVRDHELKLQRKDGSVIDVSLNVSAIRDEQGRVVLSRSICRDITERKEAEEALRESEDKFRLAMEATRDGLWDWNVQTGEVYYSPAWGQILGEDEVTPEYGTWESRLHPEDKAAALTTLREHLGGKNAAWQFEHRLRMQGGKWKWVLGRGQVVSRDAQGKPLRMVGTMTDITERKEAEEALRIRARVFESMVEGVNVSDENGVTLFCNPAFEAMFGYEQGELIGKHVSILNANPSAENARMVGEIIRTLKSLGSYRGEFSNLRKDGTLFTTSARISALEVGAAQCYVSVQEDITERKRAEAALRARESLLNATLESTADGILVVNEKGQVTHSNARIAEMWRIPKELFSTGDNRKLLAHAAAQLAAPESFLAKAEALNRSSAENYDTLVFNDGRVFERHSYPLVREGQIAGRVLSFRDVTDRKQAEERARTHLAELAHASRVSIMGEMAGGLAHELNQPLGAIVNYADACVALMRSGSAAPEDLYGEMEKVSAQARRAGEIIRRLSNFVRKREHGRSTVLINDLVREVVNLVRADVRLSGVAVGIEPGDDLPMLSCDSIQIEQVILNLIQNARDALQEMEPGARRVTIRTARAANDAVEIAVSDTGPGMPAEAAEQAFEPFFTTKPHGTGLGLSISRSIVEAHGGRLWATPNPDQGVTFRIHLPLSIHGDGDEPGGDGFHRG